MTRQPIPTAAAVWIRARTLATTWLDGESYAISKMPSESLAPLLLAVALFVVFIALIFELMWLTLAALVATFAIGCYWVWPRRKEQTA